MNTPTQNNVTQTPEEMQFQASGRQALETGDYAEAIEAFKKALHHNIDSSDTHYALGFCYHQTGQVDKAIDHYQLSTTLRPNNIDSWLNLARVRIQAGRFTEALSAIRQGRKLTESKNDPEIIKLLARTIAPMQDFDINRYFVEEVSSCFHSNTVNPDPLVHTAQKLFLHQAVVKKVLEHTSGSKIRDFEALLKDPALNWPVFNHPLFLCMMRKTILWDKDIETILSALRSHFLEKAANGSLEGDIWPNGLEFLSALAAQCFINEYIYDVTEEEEKLLKQLDPANDPFALAITASYKPLTSLTDTANLLEADHEALKPLLQMQIAEPLAEEKIKTELKTLTSIDDEISMLVKEQYEANPYPRWISAPVDKPASLGFVMKYLFPYLEDSTLPAPDMKPEILVAGCGTGKQSVESAQLFQNSHMTAIDITAASLAYAQRKTNEMGLSENIDYGLADILKLRELDQSFDCIQCGGVLHHMREPMEGWQVLNDILKPGGFMFIALYSEIARRSVAAARDYISQNNIEPTPEGIREFRKHAKTLPEDNPIKRAMDWQDFYSLSQCRDLVFHVQEHRYTALDLKKSIEELGLEFLGFQLPSGDILPAYRAQFPDDPYGLNLENWHQFELNNPKTFISMYQFWLRKPE